MMQQIKPAIEWTQAQIGYCAPPPSQPSGLFIPDPWGAFLLLFTIVAFVVIGSICYGYGQKEAESKILGDDLRSARDKQPATDALIMSRNRREFFENLARDPEIGESELTLRMKRWDDQKFNA